MCSTERIRPMTSGSRSG